MGKLYTIGHSTYPMKHFIELLKEYHIQYLLDVRSVPYSKFAEEYNEAHLRNVLNKSGIKYCYMGKHFGARQPNQQFYPEGYLNFEYFRRSKLFIDGRDSVIRGLNKYGYNIALMCTEKEPIDCHRSIMLGRGFELANIDVNHILSDGNIAHQKSIDAKLLDMYCPDRFQSSLFDIDANNKTEDDYVREAYAQQNRKIGYRLKSDSEGGTI